MKKTLERARERFGQVPAELAWVPVQLAEAYSRAELFAKAGPIYREALELARRQFGSADPRTASAMAALGLNLLKQGKWPEAELVLRDCLAIRTEVIPDDWSRYNTMSLLGGALLGQAKYAEAEPLIVAGYEGLKARAAQIPPLAQSRLTEAAARVVRLYEAWGKRGETARWGARLGLADLPADVFTPDRRRDRSSGRDGRVGADRPPGRLSP
jgi:eukaryotic-like serine/threonine-protein kinase